MWSNRILSQKFHDLIFKDLRKMAKIIDGSSMAAEVRAEIKDEVKRFIAEGNRTPKLIAVLVGDDPASHTYVRNKLKAGQEVGIVCDSLLLPKETSQAELLSKIEDLNNDMSVDGILVQLPVPEHIDERTICNAVCVDKDVDGFNERNIGRLALNMNGIIPATPLGVLTMLKRSGIPTFGRRAVVVGRSKNVSLPMQLLLHSDGKNITSGLDATVTVCHRHTPPEDLKTYCKMADIIVTAVGLPKLITKDMVKPGACVIDIGITRIITENGKNKLVGDVDFDEVRQIAGHITPVPGGVGPMTVAMLMRNTLTVAKRIAGYQQQQL